MKTKVIFFILITTLYACPSDLSYFPTVREELVSGYIQLPEAALAISSDESVFAQYTNPTTKYGHGILGDKIEAEQLVIVEDSIFYELELDADMVFEDIRPRLYDVDQDGSLEYICIRTDVNKGAGIAIYKLVEDQIIEYAYVPEIGTTNRWLNIVAIDDLDMDGIVEIAWIETPHIGGILKVAKIQEGALTVLDEVSGYSNHAIGETNLCLSVLTQQENQKIIYVPSQDRSRIAGFSFQNGALSFFNEVEFAVDFSIPLRSQYAFTNLVNLPQDNCIFTE